MSRSARIVHRRPLSYAAGADPLEDRPAHVRAGSSLAWFRDRLWIAQDDAAFLAHLSHPDAPVLHLTLDELEDGKRLHDDTRGNKSLKLDLELMVALEDRLLVFGSGSSPKRERIVELRDRACMHDGHALYEAMRRDTRFSGSELNLEGVIAFEADVIFFQRGNGARKNDLDPISATARVSMRGLLEWLEGGALPDLRDVRAWDLGAIDGSTLGFTDAVVRDGRILYVAAAEASADAISDGPVAGVVLGVLGDTPRHCLLLDEAGAPSKDKVEGLALDRRDPSRLLGIVDRDDPNAPSELVTIALEGAW